MPPSALDPAGVAARLGQLRERLHRAGGDHVGIVAVTKGFGAEAVLAALEVGLTMVGENYAQEAVPKIAEVRALGLDPEVHFIGQLQSNKVRQLAGTVHVWQSVDRSSLVTEVARRAPGARIYVQVNATDEAGKGGCSRGDVESLVASAHDAGLRVEGLMCVGPTDQDAARTREAFAWTRACADRLGLAGCSMGMSDDLEIAVGEGATLVRVGTALFGPRSHPR